MKNTLSKEAVLNTFQQLVNTHNNNKNKITTKEEEAVFEQQKALVEKVTAYTSEAIVKDLANLQIDFGAAVEKLAHLAENELSKLSDLRAAIKVQAELYTRSEDTKIAANALFITQQEHAQKIENLEEAHKDALEALKKKIEETRKDWAEETESFAVDNVAFNSDLDKKRTKDSEEYSYQLERTYQVEKDQYELDKVTLSRELDTKNTENEKAWSLREKTLEEQIEDYTKHKEKVDGFEEALKEVCNKAKDKSMKQASKLAKEEMELFEKEVAAQKRMAELRIENLKATIEANKTEIDRLTTDVTKAQSEVRTMSLSALSEK